MIPVVRSSSSVVGMEGDSTAKPLALRVALRLVVALALLGGVATGAFAGDTIRVLTYNTHGLPAWIAGDDPETRFPKIGELVNRFHLVLLQEDFRFHALLRESARHRTITRGNASLRSACPICSGAGLTTLASDPVAFDGSWNVPFETCSGWVLGGSDCLASKGFQLARVRLGSGAVFYVVNTHLDAGEGSEDRAVRAEQLALLRRVVETRAADAALILAGDLNLNEAQPEDQALLGEFQQALGLANTGARARPGSDWLVLDYILFRSGSDALLELRGAGEDPGFRNGEEPLSDHPALFAEFVVRPVGAVGRAPVEPVGPPYFVVEMPPSTGITAPVTYAPALDER